MDTAVYELAFGLNEWQKGETSKQGPNLISNSTFNFYTFPISKVAGRYRSIDTNILELTLRYIESPHAEKTICHFDQNKMLVSIQNSLDLGNKSTILNGAWKE